MASRDAAQGSGEQGSGEQGTGEQVAGEQGSGAAWAAGRTRHELEPALRELLGLAAAARPALARRLGLSVAEATAVEHLMAGPMGPVELARRLDLTSAAATVMVRRLEEAGHVRRQPHPQDRRRIVVVPTPGTLERVYAHLRPMVDALDALALGLDAEQRRLVAGYLSEVSEVLRRTVLADAPPPA